jgi:hypothetical protein
VKDYQQELEETEKGAGMKTKSRRAGHGACLLALTWLCALATLLPCRSAWAQAELRPLSVTKLRTVGPETIPEQRIEAGLLWQMGWYGSQFTGSGGSEDLDLLSTRAELGLRIVAGIFESGSTALELGFLLPVAFAWTKDPKPSADPTNATASAAGMGDLPFGIKYRFFSERLLSLAVGTSVTIPTGDEVAGLGTGYAQLAAGLLASSQPTRWLSIDFNFSAGGNLGVDDEDRNTVPSWGLSHQLGLALLTPVVMPCLELVWRVNRTTGDAARSAHFLAINLGLNIQLNDKVILMQGAQIDMAGSNRPKGAMWFMSFLFLV